jgi:hypothetical protein
MNISDTPDHSQPRWSEFFKKWESVNRPKSSQCFGSERDAIQAEFSDLIDFEDESEPESEEEPKVQMAKKSRVRRLDSDDSLVEYLREKVLFSFSLGFYFQIFRPPITPTLRTMRMRSSTTSLAR